MAWRLWLALIFAVAPCRGAQQEIIAHPAERGAVSAPQLPALPAPELGLMASASAGVDPRFPEPARAVGPLDRERPARPAQAPVENAVPSALTAVRSGEEQGEDRMWKAGADGDAETTDARAGLPKLESLSAADAQAQAAAFDGAASLPQPANQPVALGTIVRRYPRAMAALAGSAGLLSFSAYRLLTEEWRYQHYHALVVAHHHLSAWQRFNLGDLNDLITIPTFWAAMYLGNALLGLFVGQVPEGRSTRKLMAISISGLTVVAGLADALGHLFSRYHRVFWDNLEMYGLGLVIALIAISLSRWVGERGSR